MTATKHTPAPWRLKIRPATGAAHGCTVADIEPDGPYRGDIARLQSCEHINGIAADEMIANARLIAAAPETAAERDRLKEVNAALIGALQFYAEGAPVCESDDGSGAARTSGCASALCEFPECAKSQFPVWDLGRRARAAIAKARGEG